MKTRDLHWFDLFARRGSRRDFLRAGRDAAALVALGALPGCGVGVRPGPVRFGSFPFGLGVASGDPSPSGVVLWTRLAAPALVEAGLMDAAVPVRWEVADDASFRSVVQTGSADARPELGHSVHVEVDGLRPGRDYFYRMIAGGEESAVGRTRTAPEAGSAVDHFRFAFVSCQHYEQGFYTAFEHLAAEAPELVMHLGDYIYEEDASSSVVREHEPSPVMTLEEYRARYVTYRADPQLQAAHAAAPWVVTPDDHDVADNYAGDVADDGQPRDEFLLRRAAAYQAYYEFMPVRRSSMPRGPDMQIYRRLRFGSLLEMNVLDTRQYRDDQPCGDRIKPTCPEHVEPERTLLGAAQRRWLFDGLAAAPCRWNVLAQQVLFARFRNFDEEGRETWSMDKWDGYPVERQAVLDRWAQAGTPNPIVITGDIHSSWVTALKREFEVETSPVVGTEFAGTSISSGGDGQPMTFWGEAALRHNEHVQFYDSRRGYVVASVQPQAWTTEFRAVPYVSTPGAPIETVGRFVVEDGRPGAQRA